MAALHSLYSTEYSTCQVNFHDRESGQFKKCGEQIEKSYLSYLKERESNAIHASQVMAGRKG